MERTQTQRWLSKHWPRHDAAVRAKVAETVERLGLDPDEVVNDTMLKLLRLDSLRNSQLENESDGKVQGTLSYYCVRHAMDMARQADRQTTSLTQDPVAREDASPDFRTELVERVQENAKILTKALQACEALPAKQRLVMENQFDETGAGPTEIGRRLRMSPQSVQVTTTRALTNIRSYLRGRPTASMRRQRRNRAQYRVSDPSRLLHFSAPAAA